MYIRACMHVCIIFTVAPSISTSPSNQIAGASSNVSYNCIANANPQATIQWIKNENLLSNTTSIIISSTTMGNCTITDPPDQCVTSSTLRIFNTQPSDSGVYTCNATNEVGYVGENATLTVTGMCNTLPHTYIVNQIQKPDIITYFIF